MISKIPLGIKSCVKNKERRTAIEHTWLKTLDLEKFFPVFLVGRKDQPSELVGNTLYVDCHDHYQGLSGKMKEFYRWALAKTSASHFWSCDDDSYINGAVFNDYDTCSNFDYCGSFIYGLNKEPNRLSGYTSGCGTCVSRRAAGLCAEHMPYTAPDDDVATGDVLNEYMPDIKKLHIESIHPWSYCQRHDNLMIGHYVHSGEHCESNFYKSMKKMHALYNEPSIEENIDFALYLTGVLNKMFKADPQKENEYLIDTKSIHFIWIGSPIPNKYVRNVIRCKEVNPQYEVNLWLDHEFPQNLADAGVVCRDVGDLNPSSKCLLDQIEKHAGRKDVLSYEILYKHGGIFSDIDAVFLKSFDENFDRSFVSHTSGCFNVCVGIFGFNKGSKFLKFVLDCFSENFQDLSKDAWLPDLTGPTFFTTCFVQYADVNIRTINQDFLIFNNPYSYCYQTMDANW
jgi:mannosyltransferase OCH1-like enzyme